MVVSENKVKLVNLFMILVSISFLAWRINRLSISSWGLTFIALVAITRFAKKKLNTSDTLILAMWFIYISGGFLTYFLQTNPPLVRSQQFFPTFSSGVVPLAVFICTRSLVFTEKDIERTLSSVFISMLGFFCLVVLGFIFGFAEPESAMIRDQFNVALKLGGIEFNTTATWTGAIVAMIMPLVLIRQSRSKIFARKRLLEVFVILAGIITFINSFTRGSVAGISISVLTLIILLHIFLRRSNLMKISRGLVLFALLFASLSLIMTFPLDAINKFVELKEHGFQTPNIQFRRHLFESSYQYAFENFHGVGFGTLWIESILDEVNFFAWAANGTGLLGIIGFWGVTGVYIYVFLRKLYSDFPIQRYYAIAGITSMLGTYIAAVGNDKILSFPQSTIPFWTIVTCCYVGTKLPTTVITLHKKTFGQLLRYPSSSYK